MTKKRTSHRLSLSLPWLFAFFLYGCSPSTNDLPISLYSGGGPLSAVCTTSLVGDIVSIVGGENVKVTLLMGEDVDPHTYKASPGDVAHLNRADIVFYSGLHLEGKIADIFESLARRKPTVAVSGNEEAAHWIKDENGAIDPHFWFDVPLWKQAVDIVANELARFDPPHAEGYRSRAKEYQGQLDQLHMEVKSAFESLPNERRVLVTAHDAFAYFSRAYDFEVRSIQGISTDSEAGLREINKLVDFIIERGLKAIFAENIVSERNVQALVEGCAARNHEVRIGGKLYSDALGKPGSSQGTYLDMIRYNAQTIVSALK